MRVIFSGKTKEDFKRYKDYLRRTKKSDGHKYQEYELEGITKSLKNNISKSVGNTKEHKNSIYPKEFEYNSNDYKMHVDKKSHHIVFYTIEPTKTGKETIQIHKCIHSKKLKEELDNKGIKPLEDADKSLLDDMKEVEKEDEIASRDDSDDEEQGKEEEVYDKKTGEEVKRVVYTGPNGGRYYKTDKGVKVYIEEVKSRKNLKQRLLESKLIPLI
ncbi:MAG: hypothetical protein IJ213_08775 [Bacteroidales bacterium]|nr:hypothetical protein [Bacteroidales bacterium]